MTNPSPNNPNQSSQSSSPSTSNGNNSSNHNGDHDDNNKPKRFKLMIDCMETTELISLSREAPLSFGQKFFLYTHLMGCSNCRNFYRNTDTLSKMIQSHKQQSNNLHTKCAPIHADDKVKQDKQDKANDKPDV